MQPMQGLLLDLRYAVGHYRRRAMVTTLALLALTLAIGVTTGVFSVMNALLFRSLPFKEPERIVELANFSSIELGLHNRAAFNSWQEQSSWWYAVAAYRSPDMSLSRTGEAVRVKVAETTARIFSTLGSELQLGRTFAPDEDMAGKDSVAIIGYGVWQGLFGGDPSILGSTARLNGVPVTVIGVTLPGFDYPQKTEVWTPTYFDSYLLPKSDGFLGSAIGRLKTDLTLKQATAISQSELRRTYPEGMNRENRPYLISLRDRLTGSTRQAFWVLFAVAVFVLLIACASVAQLLLAQIIERRQEMALRTALGATHSRLVWQLIAEGTLLTATASVVGLAVAHWASQFALSVQPTSLSTQQYTILDWRVLGFAVAMALLSGLFFGALPAVMMGSIYANSKTLRSQTGASSNIARIRSLLACSQAAVAVILVAGSFTMGRSFLKLVRADLGIHPNNVASLTVSLLGSHYNTDQRASQYYQEALDRMRAVVGVESAGAADYIPLLRVESVEIRRPRLDSGQILDAVPVSISPGYFTSIGTSLMAGRDFTDADRTSSEPVAIVNEQFVSAADAGFTLIGRKIGLPGKRPTTIVGIVRNTRFGLDPQSFAQLFLPAAQHPPLFATFVARVRGDPEHYLTVLRERIKQVDPQIPVYDVKTLDQRMRDALSRPRFYTTAIQFLGVFTVLLAVIGTYGSASYSIAQRTHEIGVRLAVGATPQGLRRKLVRQGMLPVMVGVILGILGAVGSGRFLQHLIESAEPTGLLVCATTAAALAAVAAGALWIATSRIIRIDPLAALRPV